MSLLVNSTTITWTEVGGPGGTLRGDVSVSGFATSGTFTLLANATSTIVPVTGCLPTSKMSMPCPITPHAGNDLGTISFTMQTNQFTVTHANNARVDRTFMYILFF